GVDLGQVVGEHGLDDDALDLLDAPDVAALVAGLVLLGVCGGSHESPFRPLRHRKRRRRTTLRQTRASAPATTSMISWVISAWRARFISSVRSSMTSPAFWDALRIAVMRAPCSDAVDSSSAR